MSTKKNPQALKPATMQDLLDYTSAILTTTGNVMGRLLPLLVKHPLVSVESFDALQAELEELATEYGDVQSAFAQTIVDGLIDSLDIERGRFESKTGNTA